jgi:hypothetical protein
MPATTHRPAATAVPAAALTTYAVRLVALDGPCPLGGPDLPALSEEFTVQAADRRAAYRQAPTRTSLRLMGQELRVSIDGTQELASA